MFLRICLILSVLAGFPAMHAVDSDGYITQDDASTASTEGVPALLPVLTDQEKADLLFDQMIAESALEKHMPYKNMKQAREFVDNALDWLNEVDGLNNNNDIHPVAGSLHCAFCAHDEIAQEILKDKKTFAKIQNSSVIRHLLAVYDKDKRVPEVILALANAGMTQFDINLNVHLIEQYGYSQAQYALLAEFTW